MTGSTADAEDATQEIFLDIWRSASRFDALLGHRFDALLGQESTFIATIARRRLIDRIRRHAPERATVSLETLDFLPESEVTGSAESSFDLEQVIRALQSLPSTHRQVLVLTLIEGLSHSEIAEQLNMPLGTVKSSARRGLVQLREMVNGSVVMTKVRSDV